jgi:excisionase family DNA binding protein
MEREERMLTVKEAASKARVDPQTIYRNVWSKNIPAQRVGKSWRIPESAICLSHQPRNI